MKFEDWYKHDFGEGDFWMKQKNLACWNACKKEVLKILYKYKTVEDVHGVEFPVIDIRALEDIEKL